MKSSLLRYFLLILTISLADLSHSQQRRDVHGFISGLDSIRSELRIPAMAVAVMQNDSLLFAEGLGYSNIEQKEKATANTSFRIASITKTFTSTIIMQLVEEGKLKLSDPISKYGVDLGNPNITVLHLLTHTSEGKPGTHFQYNGFRYGKLGDVIEKATGKSFYQLVMEKIIQPLSLSSTAPGIDRDLYTTYGKNHDDVLPYFTAAYEHLAKPYQIDSAGDIIPTTYLDEFGAFGGLISTVKDLLSYSKAIDQHRFVSAQTQKKIFTRNHTTDGKETPYGLGWFVETYNGIDFYWHYGQTQGESGLFVKVPSKHLTLAVLANTEMLSMPFPLGDGDLFTSPVGQLFYKYFINTNSDLAFIDYHSSAENVRKKLLSAKQKATNDFYDKELIAQAAMSNVSRDSAKAREFYLLYGEMNFPKNKSLPVRHVIAALTNVGTNKEMTQSFTLSKSTSMKIYGVGENCSADFSQWCDYGWIENASGKIVWQMQGQPAKHAGGAMKNQRVEAGITLPAGTYVLHYKSDYAHGYNAWDSAPPENFFWGIALFQLSR